MPKQSLGEFLSLLRKAKGYTQQDVAEKLNISNRTLSSWETDRTVPDILILPVLADLYGVTVDELLRGERAQPDKNETIEYSDKAKRSIRKNRFGKFSARCSLLSGLAFTFEGILILAGILHLFADTPLWADILLTVTGAIGIAICVVLIFYFANAVKLAEGVVLSDDLTEDNKAFALAVKRKCGTVAARLAIPVLFFALLLAFLMLFNIVSDNFLNYYIFIIIVNVVLGVIPLACYAVYNCSGFKKLANEKQLEKFKYNKKLIVKLCLFGLIPILVFGILALAFMEPVRTEKVIYKNDNFDEFKSYMQTLIINEDDSMHTLNSAPLGEHELNFPEEAEFYVSYDLGNNFYGELEAFSSPNDYRLYYSWCVYYGLHDYGEEYGIQRCIVYEFFDKEHTVVNARFNEIDRINAEYDLTFGISITKYYQMLTNEKGYAFTCETYTDLKPLILGLFIFSIVASAVVCTVIYFVKRKKQEFSF